MKILYKGMLSTKHSWSIVGTELILALQKLGCTVAAESNNGTDGTDPRIAYNLKRRSKIDLKKYLGLSYSIPHNIRRLGTPHKLIIYNYETTTLPPGWGKMFCRDATLVLPSSEFVSNILIKNKVLENKIYTIPHGVNLERYNPEIPAHAKSDKFRFLTVSCAHARKGLDLLVRAFAEEFSSQESVSLTIKTSRFKRRRQYYEIDIDKTIFDNTKGTKPAEIIVDTNSYDNLASLYNSCNVYVSPTRSEGFGLTELEAVACKVPVITTGYGGCLDFLTLENSYLIEYKVVSASKAIQYWHYDPNAKAAEPDLRHLRALMRHTFKNYSEAEQKAEIAYNNCIPKLTWDNAAKQILNVIEMQPWGEQYKLQSGDDTEEKEDSLITSEIIEQPKMPKQEIELQREIERARARHNVAEQKQMKKGQSKNKKATISLHSIIFNEQHFVGGFLQNVYQVFDEIIIVDGGSSDKTIEIVRNFKRDYDKDNKIKLFIRPQRGLRYSKDWNQSDQRNFALAQCTKQWCFMMDADERLDKGFKENLRPLLSSERALAYALPKYHYWLGLNQIRIDQIWFPNYGYRIWKNDRKIQYEKKSRHCQPIIPGYPNILPYRKYEDRGPLLTHPIHHFHHYKLEKRGGVYRSNHKDVASVQELKQGIKLKHVPEVFDLEEIFTDSPLPSYDTTERDRDILVEQQAIKEEQQSKLGDQFRSRLNYSSQVKKVLFYYENFPFYSGGRYHLWEAALSIARLGTQVHLLTTSAPIYIRDFVVPSTLTIEVVPKIAPGVVPKKEHGFDAVFATPAFSGGAALSYARDHSIPLYSIVLETHNQILEGRSTGNNKDEHPEYWADFQLALKASSTIYVSTIYGKQKLLEWMPEINPRIVKVVPPPINVEAISSDQVDEEHAIIYVSRLVAHKNIDHLLKAVSMIDNPPAINIIGHGDKKAIDRYRNKLTINTFQEITDKQKFKLINKSKLLVTTSTYEGMGMSPIEAFYCKKPVVAYPLPVFKEVHEDRINYVEPGNIEQLSGTIKKLLVEEDYRKQRGEAGFAAAKKKYTLETIGGKILTGFNGKSKPRIAACYIVCNEEEFIKYSLESIYDFADEIIIVEGAVEEYMHAANPDGSSKDSTVKEIKIFPDPRHKITLIQGRWKNKEQQRTAYLERVTADWLLQIDGDEVYKKEDLARMFNMIQKDKKLIGLSYPLLNFWHNFKTVARGGQWELGQNRFYRIKTGYHYKTHHQLHDEMGNPIFSDRIYRKMIKTCPGVYVYHYAYCKRGENVRNKLKYYKDRGDMIDDTWTTWKPGDPKETHPIAFKHAPALKRTLGRGHARPFGGSHPDPMRKHPYYNLPYII